MKLKLLPVTLAWRRGFSVSRKQAPKRDATNTVPNVTFYYSDSTLTFFVQENVKDANLYSVHSVHKKKKKKEHIQNNVVHLVPTSHWKRCPEASPVKGTRAGLQCSGDRWWCEQPWTFAHCLLLWQSRSRSSVLSVSLVNAHLDWPVAQSRGDGKKKKNFQLCRNLLFYIWKNSSLCKDVYEDSQSSEVTVKVEEFC